MEGLQGLPKERGSSRREPAKKAIERIGGTLETLYYAFGDTDAFLIADFPDNVSAAAVSLASTAVEGVKTKTTILVTPKRSTKLSRRGRGPIIARRRVEAVPVAPIRSSPQAG